MMKKNGNKNNINNNNINANANTNKKPIKEKQIFNFEQIDKEIEEFRAKIKNSSINANSVNKVKPKISIDWLQHITKE